MNSATRPDARPPCSHLKISQDFVPLIRSKVDGTAHQADLAEEEIRYLKGLIADIERKHKLRGVQAAVTSGGRRNSGVDTRGVVPWCPNGFPFDHTAEQVCALPLSVNSLSLS